MMTFASAWPSGSVNPKSATHERAGGVFVDRDGVVGARGRVVHRHDVDVHRGDVDFGPPLPVLPPSLKVMVAVRDVPGLSEVDENPIDCISVSMRASVAFALNVIVMLDVP